MENIDESLEFSHNWLLGTLSISMRMYASLTTASVDVTVGLVTCQNRNISDTCSGMVLCQRACDIS